MTKRRRRKKAKYCPQNATQRTKDWATWTPQNIMEAGRV